MVKNNENEGDKRMGFGGFGTGADPYRLFQSISWTHGCLKPLDVVSAGPNTLLTMPRPQQSAEAT